jgi:hypothetical protein
VQIDAVVTDSKGRYVTDLTTDDFEVLEDGRPQTITYFSYVRIASETPRPAPPPGPEILPLPLPPAAPLRPEDVRRTIVLMVDDLGLSFESMARVRSALRTFVDEQMQPGDLVAVCRTGSAGHDGPVSAEAPFQIQRSANFTVGTLGAVSYIVDALRELPGRKSIVQFRRGAHLAYLCLLHPARRGKSGAAPETQARVFREDRPIYAGPAKMTAVGDRRVVQVVLRKNRCNSSNLSINPIVGAARPME